MKGKKFAECIYVTCKNSGIASVSESSDCRLIGTKESKD